MAATAWRLRAWDDPKIEKAMLERSIIAITMDEIGDVSDEPSDDELRRRLRAAIQLAGRTDQAPRALRELLAQVPFDDANRGVVVVPHVTRR